MIEEKDKGNDLKETVEIIKSAEDNQYVKFEEVLEKGEVFALTTPQLMFDAAKDIAWYNNLSNEEKEKSKKPYQIKKIKAPAYNRSYHPKDYYGYHDTTYGSGISCKYIEDLKLYLSVIDLDNHQNKDDISMEDLKEVFSEYIGKTRTIITQSGGMHIYLLSKKEPKIRDLGTNIDYQVNNNYVVLNYIYYVIIKSDKTIIKEFKSYLEANLDKLDEVGENVGFDKKMYNLMDDCTPDILVVNSSDEVLLNGLKKLEERELYTFSKIPTKDNKKKKKTKNNKSIKNGKNEKEGDRTLGLKPNEIEKLGLLFKSGRRHPAGLYLTGYLARQKFTKDSIYKLLLNFDTTEKKIYKSEIANLIQGIFDSWSNGTEIAGWNALSGLIEGATDLETKDREEIIKILQNLKTKKNNQKKLPQELIDLGWKIKGSEIAIPYADSVYWTCCVNPEIRDDRRRKKWLIAWKCYSETEECIFGEPFYGNIFINRTNSEADKEISDRNKIMGKVTNDNNFPRAKTEVKAFWNDQAYLLNKYNIEELLEHNFEKTAEEEEGSIWERIEKNPTKKTLHMEIAVELEKTHNLKRVIGNDINYYYYDEKDVMFSDLNSAKLGVIIREEHGINLPNKTLNDILSCVQRDDFLHNDKWLFKNCLFDAESYEADFESQNKKDILCIKKLGVDDRATNKINMLEYNPKLKYINNDEGETFVEKSFKQILIPKNDPNNHDLYIDFLQRLGASLLDEQIYKTIPVYKGDGDNGKSILNMLLEFIFNRHHRVITPSSLDDKFSNSLIENTSVLAFDELKEDSFSNFLDYIKKMSGGSITQAQRKMYSTETSEVSNFGMIWAFTNEVPKIPLHEKAVFRRLDILELPNTFVEKKYLKDSQNNYPIIQDIKHKLRKDIDGLSWLISVAIKVYKEMVDSGENFKCKQTADETLAIINKTNYLETFLALYTEIDDNERTTNNEIQQVFKEWIEFKELPYEITGKTPADIGYALKDLYESKLNKKNIGGKATYNIKMKDRNEIEKTFRYIYEVCEYDENTEYIIQTLDPDTRTVLNEIKKGNNSINKIKDLHENIQVTKQMKILENNGIISNTFSTQTINQNNRG